MGSAQALCGTELSSTVTFSGRAAVQWPSGERSKCGGPLVCKGRSWQLSATPLSSTGSARS